MRTKSKKATIDDIARLSGVSKSTVSRVLAEAPGVKKQTRETVYKAIHQMNYKPTALDEVSSSISADSVAVMIPEIANPMWSAFTKEIYRSISIKGLTFSLYESAFCIEKEKACIEKMLKSNPAGVISVSAMSNEMIKEVYSAFHCPVTFLDRALPNTNFHSVIQDNFLAGYMATKHLLEQGYTRVFFLAGPHESYSSNSRVEGYKTALSQSFIPFDESFIQYGDMGIQRGKLAASTLLRHSSLPCEALIIVNDETAVGFIDQVKTYGIKIPDDLAIVSFDNTALSALECFCLTSVSQPIKDMADAAARIALKRSESADSSELRILLQPELIIRKSSIRP